MWETRWAILTVPNISASATAVSAFASVILVAVAGYYAYQTRKLVKVEANGSEFEANDQS